MTGKEPVMDGEVRYDAVRQEIAARHEIARVERELRPSRLRLEARTTDTSWSSGVSAVVGALTRRAGRRAFSA
jgi:hypothetical protein